MKKIILIDGEGHCKSVIDVIEKFRSRHLWEKINRNCELKHPIWK